MSELPFHAVAVDHVGIAVAETRSHLSALLGAPASLQTMPSGVKVGRFGPEAKLELVAEARAGSPIERFLRRRGPGLHHIGLRVDEPLVGVLERLEASGYRTLGAIEASSDGRPSLFLNPSDTGGVLIELVQGPPST